MEPDAIDFAIAARRRDGLWSVEALPDKIATSVGSLVAALGGHSSDSLAIGLVSVADDFFVIVRVDGPRARLLLSDAAAALDWPLAEEVLDALGIGPPEEIDDSEFEPAGDLGLLADLGMGVEELSMLCHDADLYPDEVLESVAERLGFGERYLSLFDTV